MESTKIEYQQHNHYVDYKQVPAGKRILVIGESSKGEVHNPTKINSLKTVTALFGEGPLVDRVTEMINQGKSLTIYVMRIETGEYIYALDTISGLDFDLLYLDGLEFCVKNKPEIEYYVNMAYEKANTGRLVHAFFKTEAFDNPNELLDVFSMMEDLRYRIDGETVELGKFLSVVADQFPSNNSAAIYMSLISSLEVGESPINKPIVSSIKKKFSKDEIRLLRENGIVCFRESYHNGTVCASASCAVVTETSSHKNITNFRIAQTVMNSMIERLSEMIGTLINSSTLYRAEKIVGSTLESYFLDEILTDYYYEIDINAIENFMLIKVELVPVFTTEKIVTHSQIRLSK